MRGLVSLIIVASAFFVTAAYSQESSQLKQPNGTDYIEQPQLIGPIKPTDTLWRIAVKVRPNNSVTIYQVMQALYNANPNSFLEQNLNHIKNGAYLKVPTLAQIQAINNQLARQRSEQDDKFWEAKKNGAAPQVVTNSRQAQREQTAAEINQQASEALAALASANNNKLRDLQQQFKQSVSNLEAILLENDHLKQQLADVSNELNKVRQQLGQDSEIQQQLKALIVKQNEIIAQQQAQSAKPGTQFDFVNVLSQPPLFILLISLMALLVLFAVILWLRKRANHNAPIKPDDYFIAPVSNSAAALIDERAQHKADVFFTPPDIEKAPTVHDNEHIDFVLPAPQSHDDRAKGDAKDDCVDEIAATDAVKPQDNNLDANDSNHLQGTAQNEANTQGLNDDKVAIDATLANSIEELTQARGELKREDVEAITAAFNQAPEAAPQDELSEESSDTSQPSVNLNKTAEGNTTEGNTTEDHTDNNSKTVDELLNELQQPSVDETPQPSLTESDGDAAAHHSPSSLTDELRDSESVTLGDSAIKDPAIFDEEEPEIAADGAHLITPGRDASSPTAVDKDEQLNVLETGVTDRAVDDLLIELDDIQVKQHNQDLPQQQAQIDQTTVETAPAPLQSSHFALDAEQDMASRGEAETVDKGANNVDQAEALKITEPSELEADVDPLVNEPIKTAEPINTANFVDIDSLLEQNEATELEYEPYNDVNIDVGLSEFDAFLAGDNRTDVDTESGGYAAKLDLARAYIEIDDPDAALKMINDIINKGPEEVQAEALSLKAKLK